MNAAFFITQGLKPIVLMKISRKKYFIDGHLVIDF